MPTCNVTFQPMDRSVELDLDNPPDSGHGLAGSILEVALANNIHIEHACGGVCACATCHVVVEAGKENLNQPTEREMDLVDEAPATTLDSRLACQAIPHGDVTVRVPAWNRNAVSEARD
jgi:2Fe-2S ferredoxin